MSSFTHHLTGRRRLNVWLRVSWCCRSLAVARTAVGAAVGAAVTSVAFTRSARSALERCLESLQHDTRRGCRLCALKIVECVDRTSIQALRPWQLLATAFEVSPRLTGSPGCRLRRDDHVIGRALRLRVRQEGALTQLVRSARARAPACDSPESPPSPRK